MQALFDWLSALPPPALFGAMAVLAAVENIFPPIPADVLVAFGGFLAARNGASAWPAFACVWSGNIIGALSMYLLGRRLGSEWISRKLHVEEGGAAASRIKAWHGTYGNAALFVSRFLPGIRAVVPPVAGGLRIPLGGVAVSIAAASALWYGLITWLSFHAGANWEALSLAIKRLGVWSALGAGAIMIAILATVWRRRRQ